MPLARPYSTPFQQGPLPPAGGDRRERQAKSSDDVDEGFAVSFYGGAVLEDTEKATLERLAHEEYYREKTGRHPPENASNADLRREIEAIAGQPVNVSLVIVRINEHDRAGSFINYLDRLETFMTESRTRFVTDAVNELKVLGETSSVRGDDISKDKFQLCLALLKAQSKDGQGQERMLDAEQHAALDALKGSAALKYVFRAAEASLLRKRDGQHDRNNNFSGGGEHPASSGESRNERTRDRDRSGL